MVDNRRIIELDVLRGLAALSVMLFHYTTRYSQLFNKDWVSNGISFPNGHYGVELFFIISGFVVYMTLINSKSIKDFAIKRALRLYPAYIIAVILTFALVTLYSLPGRGVSIGVALLNLTMLQGFLGVSNVDGVYWTLTIEITFYILIGFVFLFKQTNRIVFISGLWLLLAAIQKLLYLVFKNKVILIIGKVLISSQCNLFIAGIMFYHLQKEKHIKYHVILLLCLIYQFLLINRFSGFIVLMFFAVFYMLVYKKLKIQYDHCLGRCCFYLGTISYSLYLVHQNIGYIIIRHYSSERIINIINDGNLNFYCIHSYLFY